MTAGSKIYSNAVAKYNEGRLLDAEKLKRVVEAEYDDAVRMLYDYGYGEGLPIEEADAEKLAELEIGKLISFVREYAFDETLSAYLLNPYLYNNAKAAYKSRIVAVGRQAYFPGFDEETEAVRTGDYKNLSPVMAAALEKLDSAFADGETSSMAIDVALTSASFEEELRLAGKLGGAYKKQTVKKIDYTNLLTAFRCRRARVKASAAVEMFHSGGKIDEAQLTSLLTLDAETALKNFDGEYYERVKFLFETGDFIAYERDIDDALLAGAVRDRENMVSSDPFVGYFYAKKSEIQTVKLALTCLKNGARDEIQRRLRKFCD